MKKSGLLLLFILCAFTGCNKENPNGDEKNFVPTDVIVGIKSDCTIDKVFGFVNSLDHEFDNIHYQIFASDLPSDSLQYVLDYLNAKGHKNDGTAWSVTGYLNYKTKVITIFPKFINIRNSDYQNDWLESMKVLKLKDITYLETSGCVILFHVPQGEEKIWVKKFEANDFVDWAELNYIVDINRFP